MDSYDKPYDIVIAIDFGTHGTACSVYFGDGKGRDIETQLGDLTFLKPGEGAGSAGKQLTALLLEAEGEHKLIAFGQNARERYADSCDSKKTENAAYFHTVKLHLAPKKGGRAGNMRDIMVPALALTQPLSGSGSDGAGAGFSRDGGRRMPEVPAFLLVQRTLEFVKGEAYRFLQTRMRADDVGALRIKWVVTVPAMWDDEAKSFMREAALAAGLITSAEADNLVLALEPEAAILASIADCAPSERARFVKGAKIMVVDCGGGTIDVTVDEIVEPALPGPLELREIHEASGGLWGATKVDRNFSAFLQELLGDYYRMLDHRTILDCMISWETEKVSVSGESDEDDTVQVKCHEVLDDLADKTDEEFDKKTMEALVEAFNARRGLTDDTGVSFSKSKRLKIPPVVTRKFFTDVIDNIVGHLEGILKKLGSVDAMMIAGGFAESRILQKVLKERFESPRTAVILPRRPGKVVVMGAALFALQPRAIRERVMRYSYGYLGAEAYDPATHEEHQYFVTAEGRRLVNILYPLVQKGDRIQVGQSISRSGLIPVRGDQQVIDFELYRVDEKIADPRLGRARTLVVDSKSAVGGGSSVNSEVLRDNKVGTLSITIGAPERPREQRGVNFEIKFGSTEVIASAQSTITRETRDVRIKYGAE